MHMCVYIYIYIHTYYAYTDMFGSSEHRSRFSGWSRGSGRGSSCLGGGHAQSRVSCLTMVESKNTIGGCLDIP